MDYGIRGQELRWFTSYLFQRTQLVKMDNTRSSAYSVVPQGSILGPLLFVVFFNDIVDSLSNLEIVMYADDAVVLYAHKRGVNQSKKSRTLLKKSVKIQQQNQQQIQERIK